MAMKYIKEVKIYVLYQERCQVLKISPTFIAYNMGHGTKNES